jgi:hypothetical protein
VQTTRQIAGRILFAQRPGIDDGNIIRTLLENAHLWNLVGYLNVMLREKTHGNRSL